MLVVNVCVYVYAGSVSLVCVRAAAFFALPSSATIYRYRCTYGSVRVSVHAYTRANKRILACVRMFEEAALLWQSTVVAMRR